MASFERAPSEIRTTISRCTCSSTTIVHCPRAASLGQTHFSCGACPKPLPESKPDHGPSPCNETSDGAFMRYCDCDLMLRVLQDPQLIKEFDELYKTSMEGVDDPYKA